MLFQLSNSETVVFMIELDGTVRCVPNDPANRHWQQYQTWLAEGNEPLPAPEEE